MVECILALATYAVSVMSLKRCGAALCHSSVRQANFKKSIAY